MPADLTRLFTDSLIQELEALRDQLRTLAEPLSEMTFGRKPLEPSNSVGHLVPHLTGNLSHFVGAQLVRPGTSGIASGNSRIALRPAKQRRCADWTKQLPWSGEWWVDYPPSKLAAPHPTERFGPTLKALIFLSNHFAIHQGQISYIARLVGDESRTRRKVNKEGRKWSCAGAAGFLAQDRRSGQIFELSARLVDPFMSSEQRTIRTVSGAVYCHGGAR